MANIPYIPQNYYNSPAPAKPAPSPKGDISAINASPQAMMGPIPGVSSQSGAMSELYGYPAPSIPNDGALQKTGPSSWTAGPSGPSKGSGFTDPQSDYAAQAIKVYESMGPKQEGGDVGFTGVPGTGKLADYERSKAGMTGNTGKTPSQPYSIGGGGGGGGLDQPQPRDPYQALQSPDMPRFEGEEYTPPERDQAIYDQERRKAMGPGMRALREGTREAISSSQSLDNPNARSKFIQQALHGYGKGLESVASQADRQATMTADKRQAEAVSMYRTKYEYKRNEDLMNYKTEIGKIAADFAAESAADMMNYNAGFGQEGGQITTNSSGARSKSTYYGNNPNIGYFGM